MSRTKKLQKLWPLARAITVVGTVGVMTTMVTFAAIQSTGNALTGNTIQTASASLQISTTGSFFSNSVPGFSFADLIPGGSAQPAANTYMAYLKNTGTSNVGLSLTVPTVPTINGTIDLAKVSVLLTPPTVGGVPGVTQSFNLASLIAGRVSIANSLVAVGSVASYHVQVSMAADAVSGTGATISGLDLMFSGTPQ